MMRSDPGGDDTVRLGPNSRPPAKDARVPTLLAAAAGGVVIVAAIVWLLWPHAAPPPPPPQVQAVAVARPPVTAAPVAPGAAQNAAPVEFQIETATEQQIRDHVPNGLTVFRFAADPRIVVLDFASLQEQGLMLNRVAALQEKAATPRDRVLTDTQLDQAIQAGGDTVGTYYYGHDYSATELVSFFNLADAEHVALYPQEETLRRLLVQLGWFLPGTQGGLISIPKVGANARVSYQARSAILHHELSHGEYFSNPDYVAYVHQFWANALTPAERDAVRHFLRSEEYDSTSDGLMQNEMQAYLMFTRDPVFFTPEDIHMPPVRLAALQQAFMQDLPVAWLRAMMNETLSIPASASK